MISKEAQLSRSLSEILQTIWKPNAVYFACINERKSSGRSMKFLKTMGLVSGAPDGVCFWENGCGGLELKIKGSYQTSSQRDFELWCGTVGVRYKVARSIEEVQEILIEWKILDPSKRLSSNPLQVSNP